MSIPSSIKGTSSLGCRISSRRPHSLNVPRPRNIVTTNSTFETSQRARVSVAAARPAKQKQPGRNENPTSPPRRRKREAPRLNPFNAYRVTPYKLVNTYTRKLRLGYPMLIRNLPGFLDGQNWFDHTDNDDFFKPLPASQRKDSGPGFDVLKSILLKAVTGRAKENSDLNSNPPDLRTVFDDFEAECKISQSWLERDHQPLLLFRDWVQRSQFRDYSLEKIINRLLKNSRVALGQPWIIFKAPLAFFRAVHQYNYEQIKATDSTAELESSTGHDEDYPTCISRLNGLVVLRNTLTEEFPFPRIVRDIGQSTYQTKACNIRVGVRPLRSNMRYYNTSTVVVGQLVGYSVVTLIPPQVKLLNGKSLEFHERLAWLRRRRTLQFPLGVPSVALSGGTWTREFEAELTASGDILLASLIPGDGLLVPKGWWYGVRSINDGLELHATVTWFLSSDDRVTGDEEEYDRPEYRKGFAPFVEI